jgi:hypothetical protein
VLIRDILHGVVSDFGYSGSPFTRFLEVLTELAGRPFDIDDDDDEMIGRTGIKQFLQVFGYLAKVPTRQIIRSYDYYDRYQEGEIDDFSYFQAIVSGKKKNQ